MQLAAKQQQTTRASLAQKAPVRILHVIRQGSIGGGESHVLELVKHLNSADYQSVVLAFSTGAMVERLQKSGFRTYVVESAHAFDFSIGKQVRYIIAAEQIQLVHIHGTRAFSNLMLPLRQLQLPVVYTVHGWSFHAGQSPLTYYARKLAEEFFCKTACQVITVSQANHAAGKQLFPDFDSVTIPNGVDVERFNRNKVQANVRSTLGIPADAFTVGFIARMTEQKQPLMMLRAFEEAVQQSGGSNSPLHLLMVGDGDLRAETENYVRQSAVLQGKVCLQGFRTDVPELLAACNAYCLPSLWEGLPMGLLEAMAMHLPCIATSVDGTCNVLQHEHNGLLIPPTDASALADAVLRLLHDKDLCQQLGAEARRTVEMHFSAQKMATRTAAVYEKLMAAHR